MSVQIPTGSQSERDRWSSLLYPGSAEYFTKVEPEHHQHTCAFQNTLWVCCFIYRLILTGRQFIGMTANREYDRIRVTPDFIDPTSLV